MPLFHLFYRFGLHGPVRWVKTPNNTGQVIMPLRFMNIHLLKYSFLHTHTKRCLLKPGFIGEGGSKTNPWRLVESYCGVIIQEHLILQSHCSSYRCIFRLLWNPFNLKTNGYLFPDKASFMLDLKYLLIESSPYISLLELIIRINYSCCKHIFKNTNCMLIFFKVNIRVL